MYRTATSNRMLGLAVTTAMAGALLSGCATNAAPAAHVSASKAEAALASGKHSGAIAHAEAAVLAEPRNAAYRAMLGAAYLEAGRFASAATSFEDAMELGDASPRTVLSLALAHLGTARNHEAAALLHAHDSRIAAADVGLALALAGETGRGIHIMSNAIRAGDNNAKIRQNLAYAYALNGQWREARLMAEQDVPADKVGERIEQWALSAHPEAFQHRVATLLGAPAGARDGGQPVQLALANTPSIEALAAPALALAEEQPVELPPVAVAQELPAIERVETPASTTSNDFQSAFAAPAPAPVTQAVAPVAQDAARFAQAVVQPAPARTAAASVDRPAPAAAAGTHLIQLGSFATEQGARAAWSIYARKYPELAGHRMVISEAVVKGKRYWRVSAGGFARAGAASMCGKVKARGEGCFAYAEGRPLPGAVDTGVRLARR